MTWAKLLTVKSETRGTQVFLLLRLPRWPQQNWDPRRSDSLCEELHGSSCWTRSSELSQCSAYPDRPLPALPSGLHFRHTHGKYKAQPVGYSWALFTLLGKKEKILDLKDRLNIQTVDFEYGLREKSHKVPFEQREPTYCRCGKEVEIKYTAHVTFISFSINLQVMN